MQCIHCEGDTKVLESCYQGGKIDRWVRRRRECKSCQRRFTTEEKIVESTLNGSKISSQFSRLKLDGEVEICCYGRKLIVKQEGNKIKVYDSETGEVVSDITDNSKSSAAMKKENQKPVPLGWG